jgi:hypothetical protein
MAINSTFRELLSQPTDQAERPRALAVGHYIGTILGHELGTSARKQTPFVRFTVQMEEATSDVPEGANDGIDLSTRQLAKTLYITPKSIYRLADCLDAILGKEQGRSYDERIPDTRGVRVLCDVSQRPNEDETEFFNEVGTMVKA